MAMQLTNKESSMSTVLDEIKILDLLFGCPQERILDSQFNSLRVELPAIQRAILREFFCHQKTLEQIASDLEMDIQEIADNLAFAVVRLDQYQRRLIAKLGNVLPFRSRKTSEPCHRCKTQLIGFSPEKYCPYCLWDELKDPGTPSNTDGGTN